MRWAGAGGLLVAGITVGAVVTWAWQGGVNRWLTGGHDPASAASAPAVPPSATPTVTPTVAPSAAVEAAPLIAGRYAPRDECGVLPGFAAFRARLGDAVRGRDVAALTALADANVMLDYGGGAGRRELSARLRSADGADLWKALDAALALGCAQQDGGATIPWFFAQDIGEAEPYSTMLAVGPDVPLYDHAGGGRLVARLSWALVEVPGSIDEGVKDVRVKVISPAGPSGFAALSRLRSVVDYRLTVHRGAGGWRIDTFVAGD
ncbi:hypothetical protein GTZ99_03835 [Novosphingobium sp. FSY-8]|uniref:Uncharacterized protein n=1 Tax=Novosphingobium ovatum TaxID=1908523 RepID=A0ABW9XAX2_9SPHN|nr:hypothetical protein [Novosphingobium ovatum]NBC35683.1 hypothetical protein [Novosphingobium ovatum]